MAPVIPTKGRAEKQSDECSERRSGLLCRVKYSNRLPDIPFDPKAIKYPFESKRFVSYKTSSLELIHRHDLLTNHNLDVDIDLINPDSYEPTSDAKLDEIDEKLIEDETTTTTDTRRHQCHNKAVPWLKKTQYISSEFNRLGVNNEKTETKVGYNLKKKLSEEINYFDRNRQIEAIDRTFSAAKEPITERPDKPGVHPVEVLPLLPDHKLWKYPFAQVMFNAEPAPITQSAQMSQALIRGVVDESGDNFVAYFLPTEETINKRANDKLNDKEYVEGEDYEYIMAREYNWNVKNKGTKGYDDHYFFVVRDDCVVYNELETRVRLSKRQTRHGLANRSTRLIVKHKPLDAQELEAQDIRMKQLEALEEEEEEQTVDNSGDKTTNDAMETNESQESIEPEKSSSSALSSDEKSSSSALSSDDKSSSSALSSDDSTSSDSDSSDGVVSSARVPISKADAKFIFGDSSDDSN